ncbi:MAG: insulinase family protein [Myxococcales bacterium]|nr:insulinase family protein [Myxococcales bacterium]
MRSTLRSTGPSPRRRAWLSLVVLLGWLAGLAPASADAGVLDHERYPLDNGLDVVLHVDRRLPLVAVNLTYHVGTMHDGEHPGLAHLVEHLMFRGTRHMDDGELFSRLFEAGGRGTNASTRHDLTTYHTVVPAAQLPLALWLESDRMAHVLPVITDQKVQQEIETTIDEWEDRVQSERDGPTAEAMWGALFPPGHPFHPVRPEAIAQLQPQHARDFVRRHVGPANATLVLAGDLPSDVRDQVQRYFGRRQGGAAPATPPGLVRTLTEEERVVTQSALAKIPMVLVAWVTPGLYAPGDAEADVLAATLEADRLASMVEAEAPEQWLSIHARQFSRLEQSVFVISAQGVASASPLRMLAAIDAVLERLRTQSLQPADVRRARRRFTIDTLRGLQRLEGRAARMQLYVGAGKDPDWLDADLARYDAVDERAVGAFVRDHLPLDRRVVVLSYPAKESR